MAAPVATFTPRGLQGHDASHKDLASAERAADVTLLTCRRLAAATNIVVDALSNAGSGLQHAINSAKDTELEQALAGEGEYIQNAARGVFEAYGGIGALLIGLAAALCGGLQQPLQDLERSVSAERARKHAELESLRVKHQACANAVTESMRRKERIAVSLRQALERCDTDGKAGAATGPLAWWNKATRPQEAESKLQEIMALQTVAVEEFGTRVEQVMSVSESSQKATEALMQMLRYVELDLQRTLHAALGRCAGAWGSAAEACTAASSRLRRVEQDAPPPWGPESAAQVECPGWAHLGELPFREAAGVVQGIPVGPKISSVEEAVFGDPAGDASSPVDRAPSPLRTRQSSEACAALEAAVFGSPEDDDHEVVANQDLGMDLPVAQQAMPVPTADMGDAVAISVPARAEADAESHEDTPLSGSGYRSATTPRAEAARAETPPVVAEAEVEAAGEAGDAQPPASARGVAEEEKEVARAESPLAAARPELEGAGEAAHTPSPASADEVVGEEGEAARAEPSLEAPAAAFEEAGEAAHAPPPASAGEVAGQEAEAARAAPGMELEGAGEAAYAPPPPSADEVAGEEEKEAARAEASLAAPEAELGAGEAAHAPPPASAGEVAGEEEKEAARAEGSFAAPEAELERAGEATHEPPPSSAGEVAGEEAEEARAEVSPVAPGAELEEAGEAPVLPEAAVDEAAEDIPEAAVRDTTALTGSEQPEARKSVTEEWAKLEEEKLAAREAQDTREIHLLEREAELHGLQMQLEDQQSKLLEQRKTVALEQARCLAILEASTPRTHRSSPETHEMSGDSPIHGLEAAEAAAPTTPLAAGTPPTVASPRPPLTTQMTQEVVEREFSSEKIWEQVNWASVGDSHPAVPSFSGEGRGGEPEPVSVLSAVPEALASSAPLPDSAGISTAAPMPGPSAPPVFGGAVEEDGQGSQAARPPDTVVAQAPAEFAGTPPPSSPGAGLRGLEAVGRSSPHRGGEHPASFAPEARTGPETPLRRTLAVPAPAGAGSASASTPPTPTGSAGSATGRPSYGVRPHREEYSGEGEELYRKLERQRRLLEEQELEADGVPGASAAAPISGTASPPAKVPTAPGSPGLSGTSTPRPLRESPRLLPQEHSADSDELQRKLERQRWLAENPNANADVSMGEPQGRQVSKGRMPGVHPEFAAKLEARRQEVDAAEAEG